ncbi:hypothetical protein EYF80_003298 [Liparis tanakae]|uniref:Uncharacterized protein n=1 Tax=Liparis tanakae TaxID=230148 RepID=A0A4Z2JA32_9TELE|nr:hypothetical protein EYF80_003298 [Liparis tanakae]
MSSQQSFDPANLMDLHRKHVPSADTFITARLDARHLRGSAGTDKTVTSKGEEDDALSEGNVCKLLRHALGFGVKRCDAQTYVPWHDLPLSSSSSSSSSCSSSYLEYYLANPGAGSTSKGTLCDVLLLQRDYKDPRCGQQNAENHALLKTNVPFRSERGERNVIARQMEIDFDKSPEALRLCPRLGQSPANPCADSQDVALIHRPQPRLWGPGEGEHGERGEGPVLLMIERKGGAQRSDEAGGAGGDPGCTLRERSARSQSRPSSWEHNTTTELRFQSTTTAARGRCSPVRPGAAGQTDTRGVRRPARSQEEAGDKHRGRRRIGAAEDRSAAFFFFTAESGFAPPSTTVPVEWGSL